MTQDAELKQLDLFFRPSSVAVVGASSVKGKIGYEIVRSLVEGGFKGDIYPVTLRAKEILGLKCYERVSEIPGPVDLAVYALPSRLAPQIIEECGAKGVRNIVIVSGGFKEVGGEYRDLESEVVAIARRYGMRIIGPNCIGVFDGVSRFDTFFQPSERMSRPKAGPLSIISQSGTYGIAFLEAAIDDGIGVSKMVSYGNKADVDEADLIRYLGADESTKVIAIYMEAVGNGRRFLEALREVSPRKPIVILKTGRTQTGVRAAQSHTGWLAGSYEVAKAAFRQAGVVVADTIEELYDLAKGLALQPLPKGRRVGMVTNGAGLSVVACDLSEPLGYQVGTYTEATRRRLEEALPGYALVRDVIDLTGSATTQDYRLSMEALLEDEGVDLLMPFFVFQDSPLGEDIVEVLPEMQRYGKPILGGHAGGAYSRRLANQLHDAGIPLYPSADRVARVAAAMMDLYEFRESLDRRWAEARPTKPEVSARAERLVAVARSAGRKLLLEHEGKELVSAYGIPVAESRLARSEAEAVELAEALGGPVVLKVVSPDVLHKSDVGGVKVGLKDGGQVRAAYQAIIQAVRSKVPDARLEGILVQRMAPAGLEVIIGGLKDREFGPVVMFGLGGIFVEAIRDVAFRVAPLTRFEALEMIGEIRGRRVLEGARGAPPVDKEALADILVKLGDLLVDRGEVVEVDLNPVFAYPKGAVAADVRVLLA